MMRLSDDKMTHMSHVILRALRESGLVGFTRPENDVRLAVRAGLAEGVGVLDGIEEKVRHMLHSYSRKMVEGGREWDIQQAKLMEDELQKIRPVKE